MKLLQADATSSRGETGSCRPGISSARNEDRVAADGSGEFIAAWRRGVAPRLLAGVLLFSSIVTLILTAMQLYLDYRRSVDELSVRIEQIATAYLGGLGESLWQVDERQMAAQLRGLLSLPDIAAVELRETAGNKPVVVAMGVPGAERTVSRHFPVVHSLQEREEVIGTLRIDATLSFVYRELTERVIVILLSQGAKTFVVSLFILYIVHRLVTRHLHTIAKYVGQYRLARPPQALELNRKAAPQADEFDQVVGAFNTLTRNLQAAYDELGTRNRELQEDNAARMRAEEALRQNEQRFRDFAETASDWFWETGPDHRLVYASAGSPNHPFKGPSRIGKARWEFAIDVAEEPAKWQQHRRTLDRHEPFRGFVYKADYMDGQPGFVAVSGRPFFDADGRFLGYRGVATDVTAKIRADEALREGEQRFRDYAETASDWFWETDTSHRITFTSAEGNYAFLGPSRIGQRRWEFAADIDDEPEKWREHMDILSRHEPFRGFIYRANRNDGSAGYVSVSGKPIFDTTGTFLGYRGVGTDVTTTVRAQKALRKAKRREADHQALKLKSEAERLDLLQRLINTQEMERLRIARELHDQTGQDLTGLSLGLKSLEASVQEPRGKAMLQWLQTLTAQIGANLHRTAGELRPTALDDLGLVRALETQVTDWAGRFGIHVDFHGSSAKGVELPQDVETTVYRIVQEALTNVLKHADAKMVSLVLECHEGSLQVIVEDDGKGFDPEAPSTTAGHLGLAGIRERLALIGGTLAIDSALGVGTTLYIRIPLDRPPGPPGDVT